MNIRQLLAKFSAEYRRKQKLATTASKAVTTVLRKYFPEKRGNFAAPAVLAACVEMFDLEDSKNAGQLYLEWLMEHYIGRKVAANISDIKMVVKWLQMDGFTEDNPFEFNDGDNHLFYIPHKEKLIFCAESQNTRYIYILNRGFGNRLHIRRYYDEYDFDNKEDDYKHEKEEIYTREGIRAAITNADWLTQYWSDCIPGNQYPRRPSLQYFKDCDFDLEYSDCRDIGYVLTYENLMEPRADRAIYYYPDIHMAFFELRCAVGEAVNEWGSRSK